MTTTKIYNYKFQDIDARDYIYQHRHVPLLKSFYIGDSIQSCPVLDQFDIGSCVANASYVLFYIESKKKINVSRLQLYFCSRAVDNLSLTEDTGVSIRGCMNAVRKYGLCDEKRWSYNTSNFSKLAPSTSFTQTYSLTNFVYTFIPQNLQSIINCLSNGHPIMLGIYVYQSFESDNANKYGVIPMPNVNTEKSLGGHAIVIIGFDSSKKVFKFQNSWGTSWGDKGFGYIPFDYILNSNLAADLVSVTFKV